MYLQGKKIDLCDCRAGNLNTGKEKMYESIMLYDTVSLGFVLEENRTSGK